MTIDTPVEKVVDLLDDPRRLGSCAPMVERVVVRHRTERRVGNSFQAIYRMLGRRLSADVTVAIFESPPRHTPHRRFQMWQKFDGPVRGTFTWTLEAEGNQTYAGVDATYELAGGVFGRVIDRLVVGRAFRNAVDRMLANMQRELTGQAAAPQRVR